MEKSAKHLISKAEQLFDIRKPIMSMWQAIADNFYPARADFNHVTAQSRLTMEPADWLADSYPVICHRDLANAIDSMLRDGNWFELTLGNGEEPDHEGQLWMGEATRRMRSLMGQRDSGFSRSVKQGDMDYAAFGQTVISALPHPVTGGPLYNNWHLRDCAWFDDETGQVSGVVRRWNPTREELIRTFGKDNPKLHQDIKDKYAKEPFKREEFYHFVFPVTLFDSYDSNPRFSYYSFYVDKKHEIIVEEVPKRYQCYVIPRFFTLAECAYAYSPATMSALPDARTLQAMTFTLLEAAERYARPPVIAQSDVIQGVIDLRPDGITWVDNKYDEKMGRSLDTLKQDKGGYPIGQHERSRVVEVLREAFYLDKITLPEKAAEMTAYEMAERMKEYRRQNLPLFKPLETEYNGQICEVTFNLMMERGLLGSVADIPESLQGRDITFKYKSPLSSSEEESRMAKFQQAQQAMSMAIGIDPTVHNVLDIHEALRSSIEGMSVPAAWVRDQKQIVELVQQEREQMAIQAAAAKVTESLSQQTGATTPGPAPAAATG